ncbi:MAG: prepilin-type N-terminal cleavage/methylation domain-containing protein [Candidatus Riflebacteria bacterium]|nr:prepilin-type N-terminal cleavage/methylation domain-containing protein [Candidatus Riflebacteria bacterium]
MNRTGMSLIEVMIGVIILALVLIPSLNVIVSETRTVTATRDHLSAVFVGQRVLETARTFRYDFLDADRYTAGSAEQKRTLEWQMINDPAKNKMTVNGIDFKVSDFKIEPVKNKNDPSAAPIMVLMSYTIDYIGKDSHNHRLDVTTALARQE